MKRDYTLVLDGKVTKITRRMKVTSLSDGARRKNRDITVNGVKYTIEGVDNGTTTAGPHVTLRKKVP